MNSSTLPQISVLMPVYNGARYLREALDSIFSQSFTDFECVLIDDGSTDQTTEIIESYTDSRITYISDGQNVGLTQRLNQGLEIARGKYIARHDDDDISSPQRFAQQVELLESNQDYLGCGSRVAIIDADGDVIGGRNFALDHLALMDQNLLENQFIHGSLMLRKTELLAVGGYRPFFVYAQDYDLTLRLQEHGKLINLEAPLYSLRYSNDAISASRTGEQMAYAQHARSAAELRRQEKVDPIDARSVTELGDINFVARNDATERLLYLYLRSGYRQKARKCIDQLLEDKQSIGLQLRRLLTYLPGPLMSSFVVMLDVLRGGLR